MLVSWLPCAPGFYLESRFVFPEAWGCVIPVLIGLLLTFVLFVSLVLCAEDFFGFIACAALWSVAIFVILNLDLPWVHIRGVAQPAMLPHLIFGILFPFGFGFVSFAILIGIGLGLLSMPKKISVPVLLTLALFSGCINHTLDLDRYPEMQTGIAFNSRIIPTLASQNTIRRDKLARVDVMKNRRFNHDYSFLSSFSTKGADREFALKLHLAHGDHRSADVFVQALNDPDSDIQVIGIEGVEKLNLQSAEVNSKLESLAVDDRNSVRNSALLLLAKRGGNDVGLALFNIAAAEIRSGNEFSKEITFACNVLANHCTKSAPEFLTRLVQISEGMEPEPAIERLGDFHYAPAVDILLDRVGADMGDPQSLLSAIRTNKENGWWCGRCELVISTLAEMEATELKTFLPTLIEADDIPPGVRSAAISAAAAINDRSKLAMIRKIAASDTWQEYRKSAIGALGQLGNKQDHDFLIEIADRGRIGDVSYTTAEQLEAITTVGDRDARAIIWAVSLFKQELGLDWETRRKLNAFVVSTGEAALPLIKKVLVQPDCKSAPLAIQTAAEIGGPHTDEILSYALKSSDAYVRLSAITASRSLHKTCPDFLRRHLLANPNDWKVVALVAELDPNDKFCQLARYLVDGNYANTKHVRQILAFGERAKPVLMAVASGRDTDVEVRAKAIEGLGAYHDHDVISFLAKCVQANSRNDELDGASEHAINRIGNPAREAVYGQLHQFDHAFHNDDDLEFASRILALHPDYQELAKWLPALADKNAAKRIEAVKKLKALGPVAEPALKLVKNDRNPAVSSLIE